MSVGGIAKILSFPEPSLDLGISWFFLYRIYVARSRSRIGASKSEYHNIFEFWLLTYIFSYHLFVHLSFLKWTYENDFGVGHTTALIPLVELSDPVIAKKYGVKPDAETLDILNTVARQKEIVVVMKIYWGDAREKICEAIENIPLSCIVIGNRGLSKIKRILLGSVSNHVVNNGTCPVTVVKCAENEG